MNKTHTHPYTHPYTHIHTHIYTHKQIDIWTDRQTEGRSDC